jgi:hypothetical protein
MEISIRNTDKKVIIDDDLHWKLKYYKWYRLKTHGSDYAAANYDGKLILMHRFILNPAPDMQIDHINGDGLDNRRSNLRICTHDQNRLNRKIHKNNKCGYKGVYWAPHNKKWRAQIRRDNKRYFLGYFSDLIEAARAYNNAAIKLHGEFARLNII